MAKKSHNQTNTQKMTSAVSTGVEKVGPAFIAGENAKWCSCLESSLATCYKVIHSYCVTQEFHSSLYTPESMMNRCLWQHYS